MRYRHAAWPPAMDQAETPEMLDYGPTSTRSPLTDAFPVCDIVRSSVSRIPAPAAGASFTGAMALYPLLNIRISDLYSQDVLLAAVHASLGQTDPTPAGQTPAWGGIAGDRAAVVVGRNIPSLRPATGLGTSWSRGVVQVAYVDPALLPQAIGSRQLIWDSQLAPGDAETPGLLEVGEDYPPHVHRFRRGDRLGVAVALNATQANAAAGMGGAFLARITVRLRIGHTLTGRSLEVEQGASGA